MRRPRTGPTLSLMLRRASTTTLLLVAACQGPAAPPEDADADRPIVGRLQFQDRIVDLTPSAFEGAPGAVPKSSVAVIMADVVVQKRRD